VDDQTSPAQSLSLEGEVVEILEKPGQRHARIMLDPHAVVDIAAGGITDVHLGDRVVISGSITIERVGTKQAEESGDSR
jgi:hypothetical protein